jgi:hypothetical protein
MGCDAGGKPVPTRHAASGIDDHRFYISPNGAWKNCTIRPLLAQVPKPGDVATGTLHAYAQLAAGTLKLGRWRNGKLGVQGHLVGFRRPSGGENCSTLQEMGEVEIQKPKLLSKCPIFQRCRLIIGHKLI